jgi:hypothetical protein
VAASSVLACVVQQTLPDLLPARLLPVQTDGVHFLDLNNALAPAAGYSQDMLRDLTEALDGARMSRNRCLVMGIVEEGARQYSSGMSSLGPSERPLADSFPIEAASFSICFGVGIRQLAGRSFMTESEHKENKSRVRPREAGRFI